MSSLGLVANFNVAKYGVVGGFTVQRVQVTDVENKTSTIVEWVYGDILKPLWIFVTGETLWMIAKNDFHCFRPQP